MWGFFAKRWDYFQKFLGFLKKVEKFWQSVGVFFKNSWAFLKKWGNFCKMWGYLGGTFGGDKWGFSANLVGIFCRNLPATLKIMQFENEDPEIIY